eukprot:GEMP01045153.1.p1 GENE.GEMP01045153.1~~GEMP01045153.1.p1  ORF type:complete len:411 (-),score=82.30 GEMP01045153.1:485-1717(-)
MATQFTDDAYNKFVNRDTNTSTLIGNWFEEQSIRDATGQGRCVPERHLPRSGLLKDFTKVPATARKVNDTFGRIYGHRSAPKPDPLPGTEAIQLPTTGPRYERDRGECIDYAIEQMSQLEEAAALSTQDREFGTTTGLRDEAFPTPYNPGKFQKNSISSELAHGPPMTKDEMYVNAGMDINTEQSYAQEVPVTLHTQMVGSTNIAERNTMRVSCQNGMSAFGKNSAFSEPVAYFHGHHQLEKVNRMMEDAMFGQRHPKGPGNLALIDTDALLILKADIVNCIRDKHGIQGIASLRSDLTAKAAASGGCLAKTYLHALFKELHPTCSDVRLDLYLSQLCTMKKDAIQVTQLFSSMHGKITPNAIQGRMHNAFHAKWKPEGMNAPEDLNGFMQFMMDLYAMDSVAVENMLPP